MSIYDILSEYVLEFVNRGRHFEDFKATCDTGCGEATGNGFSAWLYRTDSESLYRKNLMRLLDGAPRFIPVCCVNPSLPVLGYRFTRNFRFLSHGRSGGGCDAYGKHNHHVREAAQLMANIEVLCDYNIKKRPICNRRGSKSCIRRRQRFRKRTCSARNIIFMRNDSGSDVSG